MYVGKCTKTFINVKKYVKIIDGYLENKFKTESQSQKNNMVTDIQ